MADALKECCRVPTNLTTPVPYEGRKDLTFRRCTICGCRHFKAIAEGMGGKK